MEPPIIVVTGANGFVGSHVVKALVEAGVTVRAIVRRPGAAPAIEGVEEHVGEFQDRDFVDQVLKNARAAVTTVHPNWSDLQTRQRVSVEGTATFARAAGEAGVERLVHLSTAAVYDLPPGSGEIDERGPLIGDHGGDYAVTKRDTEAALAEIDGITRIFVRPPALLGPGETSEFNTIRPAAMGQDKANRKINPKMSLSWVHVTDLAALVRDLATGRIAASSDPAQGPVEGAWTALNVVAGQITVGDYVGTVINALGVEANWSDEPVWTGKILAHRARDWGWTPDVGVDQALAELFDNVRSRV